MNHQLAIENGQRLDASGLVNHHCSVVEADGIGILVEGRSGSGKTSVALGLIEALARDGIAHALVSDDQALLRLEGDRLIAAAPQSIAGKVELRGFGIADMPFKPNTAISLIARLVPDETVERMPPPKALSRIAGHSLTKPVAFIELPERHEALAVRILRASLRDLGHTASIA